VCVFDKCVCVCVCVCVVHVMWCDMMWRDVYVCVCVGVCVCVMCCVHTWLFVIVVWWSGWWLFVIIELVWWYVKSPEFVHHGFNLLKPIMCYYYFIFSSFLHLWPSRCFILSWQCCQHNFFLSPSGSLLHSWWVCWPLPYGMGQIITSKVSFFFFFCRIWMKISFSLFMC